MVEYDFVCKVTSSVLLRMTSNLDGASGETPGVAKQRKQQVLICKGPIKYTKPHTVFQGQVGPHETSAQYEARLAQDQARNTRYSQVVMFNTLLAKCIARGAVPQDVFTFFRKVNYNSMYIVRLLFSCESGVNPDIACVCWLILIDYVHQRASHLANADFLDPALALAARQLMAARYSDATPKNVTKLFELGDAFKTYLAKNHLGIKNFVQVDSLHRRMTEGVGDTLAQLGLAGLSSNGALAHLFTFGSLAYNMRGVDKRVTQLTASDIPGDYGSPKWRLKIHQTAKRQADVIANTQIVKLMYRSDTFVENVATFKEYDMDYPTLEQSRQHLDANRMRSAWKAVQAEKPGSVAV